MNENVMKEKSGIKDVAGAEKGKKRRSKSRQKAVKTSVGDLGIDDVMESEALALTREEMLELDLHESRVEMQVHVRTRFSLAETVLQQKYLQERDVMRKKQTDAVASMEEAKAAYNRSVAKIEQRLGVSLKEYAVRDDGILTLVGESTGSGENSSD